MMREKPLLLKFHADEYAPVKAMAQAEKLPVALFIRRLLLLEAEKRGITVRGGENSDAVGVHA